MPSHPHQHQTSRTALLEAPLLGKLHECLLSTAQSAGASDHTTFLKKILRIRVRPIRCGKQACHLLIIFTEELEADEYDSEEGMFNEAKLKVACIALKLNVLVNCGKCRGSGFSWVQDLTTLKSATGLLSAQILYWFSNLSNVSQTVFRTINAGICLPLFMVMRVASRIISP